MWNSGYNILQLVQMRSGTEYNIICYATCADEVNSYTARGYCNLADEGWNSVQYLCAINSTMATKLYRPTWSVNGLKIK